MKRTAQTIYDILASGYRVTLCDEYLKRFYFRGIARLAENPRIT